METPGPDAAPDDVRRPSQSSSTLSSSVMALETTPSAPSRSVKRPRPVKSCVDCRKRKLKCDRLCPCSQCQKSHRVCKYISSDAGTRDGSDASDDDDDDAAAASEPPAKRLSVRAVTSDPREGTPRAALNGGDVPHPGASALMEEFSSRLERLERLLVSSNATRVELTPPLPAPPQSISLSTAPSTVRALSVKSGLGLRTRFFGQNSTRVLLNMVRTAAPPPPACLSGKGGGRVLTPRR